jgi:citrate lyase beta subunit
MNLPDALHVLEAANREFARAHPGESGQRQPVHVVYGGAHLFKHDMVRRLGALATRAVEEYAPDPAKLALATGIPNALAEIVYARVVEKLRREPVEDFRIDFEDGYGVRVDSEEDAAAIGAAEEVARAMEVDALPAFFGIRIKPLDEESKSRSLRTLDLFLKTLLDHTGGRLPENFVVTLPKITVVEQVTAVLAALDRFAAIPIELMIETPQSLFLLPQLVEASRGRLTAAHFGAYDYTASLGITASNQHMLHPACDFARTMMQAQLAGTGIRLSDGATNLMPIPPHRATLLSGKQVAENRLAVHRAWRVHFVHIRHSLDHGFYQGWDLHPAQLPARYAAVYSFFLEGLKAASERLRNFIAKAAQATQIGGVFDDAATGQGLLNYFLRAINCGAIPEADAPELTGLTLDELRSASFAKILNGRRMPAL